MALQMDFKTNVMRIIESKKISYTPYDYSSTDALSASEVAAVLGQKPERVFKRLLRRENPESTMFLCFRQMKSST